MESGNDFTFDNIAPASNDGFAHLAGSLATVAPHHAQWSAGNGAYASTSIAFGP
jgi:chitodextrinase